jgi:hypothetical protein
LPSGIIAEVLQRVFTEEVTGLGSPPTCSAQFVKEDFLGETICCVITGMFTEEEAVEE